jgi:hypothetical protein
VSLEQILSFARALDWVEIGSRDQVFCAARALLVSRREDLGLFALVFDRFWLGVFEPAVDQRLPLSPRHDLQKGGRFRVNYLASLARPEDPAVEIVDREATYSPDEVLQRRDFALMTPEELVEVRRLIDQTRWQMSLRRTRRLVPDRRGSRIHLRRMLRDAAKFGGAPPRLKHLTRKVKQRPIVLLADISGSMDKYSRLMLQFFYSATHSMREVECFVFGTAAQHRPGVGRGGKGDRRLVWGHAHWRVVGRLQPPLGAAIAAPGCGGGNRQRRLGAGRRDPAEAGDASPPPPLPSIDLAQPASRSGRLRALGGRDGGGSRLGG